MGWLDKIAMLLLVVAVTEGGANAVIQGDQSIFKKPVLQFKTPKILDFCGEPIPLERRDVWERLDKQLILALGREAQVILWLKRSRQYLPYIEDALRNQGLPDDLKYMAVAESDLNNYALSPKGAAGTWQFMQETGLRFGLKREEWNDQRYSFEKATNAALKYLRELYGQFGKWTLAAAAYNCGEGRMAREIEEQNTEHFVDLSLPRETEEYLFRILAIKIILSNPENFGFMLEEEDYYVSYDAEEVEFTLPQGLHLRVIADAAKTSFRMIKELNPDLRGYYLPAGNHRLRLPRAGIDGFQSRLNIGLTQAAKGIKSIYIVRRGETLKAIADKLGITIEVLASWNGIGRADSLQVGQKLIVYKKYVRN